jgi:N-acetylneuraminic acid mutarotase
MIKAIISLMVTFILTTGMQAQWRDGPNMPTARYGMSAVVLDNIIYVIGGAEAGRNGLGTVETFNPVTGVWSENLPEVHHARINAAGAVFDGRIFLFGGSNKNALIPQVEVYNPPRDQWTDITSMPTPREGLCAVVVDSCIWIIGGSSARNDCSWSSVITREATAGIRSLIG